MKKLLLALLILVLLGIGFIYIYIPRTLKVSEAILTRCTPEAAYRSLANADNRRKWWPKGDSIFAEEKLRDQLIVFIRNEKGWYAAKFSVFPLPQDSSAIEFQTLVESNWNPIYRLRAYNIAMATKKRMQEVLKVMKEFIDKPENIYGIDIRETSTTDTLLISTKANFKSYPATADIYKLVDKLKDYSTHQNASVAGDPLLNVEKQADNSYYVRVALPVSKVLKDNNDISFTRMIPGKFLVADVTGGPGAVAEARKEMNQYFQDYRRTSMAIPFQVLVTDRMKETDTSKWKTRIYGPVY